MQAPFTLDLDETEFHDDLKKVVAFLNVNCLDNLEAAMQKKEWLKQVSQAFVILHMEQLRMIANLQEEVTKLKIKLEN